MTILKVLVERASLRLAISAAVSALLIFLVALIESGSNGLVYRTLLIIVVLVIIWLILVAAENARAIGDYFKVYKNGHNVNNNNANDTANATNVDEHDELLHNSASELGERRG